MLEVPNHITYLGYTMPNNLMPDREIDKRMARAAGVIAGLRKKV